jgi:hypothetical protein
MLSRSASIVVSSGVAFAAFLVDKGRSQRTLFTTEAYVSKMNLAAL